jgi:hypothetical protein
MERNKDREEEEDLSYIKTEKERAKQQEFVLLKL